VEELDKVEEEPFFFCYVIDPMPSMTSMMSIVQFLGVCSRGHRGGGGLMSAVVSICLVFARAFSMLRYACYVRSLE
jgi:hypothetical protein